MQAADFKVLLSYRTYAWSHQHAHCFALSSRLPSVYVLSDDTNKAADMLIAVCNEKANISRM